jgi:hypothetical protein
MHAKTISMNSSDLKRFFLEVATSNHQYFPVTEVLQQGNVQLKYKDYKLEEDGILLYMNTVYIPNSQKFVNFSVERDAQCVMLDIQGITKLLQL